MQFLCDIICAGGRHAEAGVLRHADRHVDGRHGRTARAQVRDHSRDERPVRRVHTATLGKRYNGHRSPPFRTHAPSSVLLRLNRRSQLRV